MDARRPKRLLAEALTLVALLVAQTALAQTVESSWSATKNSAADNVYHDNLHTLYCGCPYTSDNDSDGSGDVDMTDCAMEPLGRYKKNASVIEWEHVVPVSLMPAEHFSCWQNPEQFDGCLSGSGTIGGRKCCEKVSRAARRMIFDRHNIAPSIGQVNQYRRDDRYGEVPDHGPQVEKWPGCDVKHLRVSGQHSFEPADCTKGDVARVWFYMHDEHGVVIPDEEWNMFVAWDAADPISEWEIERDARVAELQGNHNPYVEGAEADPSGACGWES